MRRWMLLVGMMWGCAETGKSASFPLEGPCQGWSHSQGTYIGEARAVHSGTLDGRELASLTWLELEGSVDPVADQLAPSFRTDFDYDAAGNRIEQRKDDGADGSVEDWWRWSYDDQDRLVRHVREDLNHIMYEETYTYEGDRLVESSAGQGVPFIDTYTYGEDGRIQQVQTSFDGDLIQVETRTYTSPAPALDHEGSLADPEGTPVGSVERTYTPDGHLATERIADGAGVTETHNEWEDGELMGYTSTSGSIRSTWRWWKADSGHVGGYLSEQVDLNYDEDVPLSWLEAEYTWQCGE